MSILSVDSFNFNQYETVQLWLNWTSVMYQIKVGCLCEGFNLIELKKNLSTLWPLTDT